MKKALFQLLLVILFNQTVAQRTNIDSASSSYMCSYFGEEIQMPLQNFKSADEAQDIIKSILAIVGLKPNFEVRASDVPNAAAVIYGNKRFILYNLGFTKKLTKAAGSSWAATSILAHEVGHHLNGHTLLAGGSRPDIELEADEFSGFVLRKLGATLRDAQVAMSIAAGEKASHTHPAKSDRLNAIADGWNTADDQLAGKTTVPKTNKKIERPVIVDQPPKKTEQVLDDRFIAYDVHFYTDPKSSYFVTVRNNLVKVSGNELFIAATMSKSNNRKYIAMFYDKQYNYLYVTSGGDIVNGVSKKVGTIRKHQG